VAAQAVDCLQVDVTRCGGITEFLRASAVAAASGLAVRRRVLAAGLALSIGIPPHAILAV
jgi:L-alanine-DL-glutamate epimerase-like enolase superfamily enzyme